MYQRNTIAFDRRQEPPESEAARIVSDAETLGDEDDVTIQFLQDVVDRFHLSGARRWIEHTKQALGRLWPEQAPAGTQLDDGGYGNAAEARLGRIPDQSGLQADEPRRTDEIFSLGRG